MSRRAAQPESLPPAAPARDGRGRMLAIAMLVSGLGAALAVYALPIFILIYGGLLPAIMGLMVDERPGRHLFVTVAAFNGAGLMVGLRPFFSHSLTDSASFQVVAEPSTWLAIYGFAITGWMLAWVVPIFVSQGLELIDRQRYRTTELERDAILEQWPSLIASPKRTVAPAEDEPPPEPLELSRRRARTVGTKA